MNDVQKFKITGAFNGSRVAQSGKVAWIKIETSIGGRRTKHELKCFDLTVMGAINTFGNGEMVTVEGVINSECLKDRQGQDIKVNNYSVWIPSLVVNSMVSANPSAGYAQNQQRPINQPKRNEQPPVDENHDFDEIPF